MKQKKRYIVLGRHKKKKIVVANKVYNKKENAKKDISSKIARKTQKENNITDIKIIEVIY